MTTKLKNYFPLIRERQDVLSEIQKKSTLNATFRSWTSEQREEFLNLCTGVRGIKLLYDGFFKEIMNPEYVPERLNDFLSHMLRQEVRILKVLPGDSTRITDESSLLIMDIVVELEDRSIANVEMQKVGYLFPGQRSACYSADLLLRQYKRIRGETNDDFSYRDIKNVFTIVLFEKVPKTFMPTHMLIIIFSNRNRIPDWRWSFCRNICSSLLTSSGKASTIKISITKQMHGCHCFPATILIR